MPKTELDEYKSDPEWINDALELSKYLNQNYSNVWYRFYDTKNIEALYYENILITIYLIVDGTDHRLNLFPNI